jgi:hypothetical protein
VRATMPHSPTSAIRAGADPSLRASHYSYHQYNYSYDHYRYQQCYLHYFYHYSHYYRYPYYPPLFFFINF